MYIGIDLGTTACKILRFDETGREQARFYKEYDLITRDGFVEQSAEAWVSLVLEGLTAVASPEVRGLSISTQGVAAVPVDRDGKPLCNAISWLDVRAGEEAALLEQTLGADAIYEKTGKFCGGSYVLPKLMWLKRHRPRIFDAAHKFLLPLDFLNLRLTGRAVTDYTVAGGTMAWNIREMRYDAQLLRIAGIPEEKLAAVACMGTPVGRLLPAVAEQTGLPADCMMYLGGQDQKLAALGAGIDENTLTLSLGTASAITRLCRKLPKRGAFSAFRFDDGCYSLEGVLDTSGAALKWLMGIMGCDDYEEMNRLAREAGGSGGVIFDADLTKGGAVSRLRVSTTRGQLAYALMEGVSRSVGEMMQTMGGCEKLVVFGGGAKSDIWCRILADTLQKPVCVPSTVETGCLGAARLASEGRLPPSEIKNTYDVKEK